MKILRFVAEDRYAALRLDKVLPQAFPEHTRNYFQILFEQGFIKLNGKIAKASVKVKMGDVVEVKLPDVKKLTIEAKDIPLDVVYEDKNVLVINKPAGLVVHPGTHGSHADDSLVNAILHHCKDSLGGINGSLRPGIVHRLDKDTSGLMVVAKNDMAQQFLMDQFMKRKVEKVYYALVVGHLEPSKGTIDAPIGRSLQDRKKMAVIQGNSSKEAVTKYEVVRYLGGFTLVKVYLLTGRTHQIRVHFAAIGFPLVGDVTYGRAKINHQFETHYGLKRQFLHAAKLSFVLPHGRGGAAANSAEKSVRSQKRGADNGVSSKKEEFESALPLDLQRVFDALDQENPSINH